METAIEIDPRKQALKMVGYRALSGLMMVAAYAIFELASTYAYYWLMERQE